MPQDKAQELAHARKIIHHPEFYWNSATPAGRRGSLRRASWVLKAAALAPGKRALEVGCGTGFFTEIFANSGAELHSIDISPELIEKAVERCLPAGQAGGTCMNFKVCDIEALPYRDDFFDAAIGVRVLHHLDMEASFLEIRRVLKPGGVIAFCEPNMLNPQIMIQKNIPWIKKMMGDTPGETAFFKWGLRKFLAERGFGEISIAPFDFLHPWVPASWTDPVEKIGAAIEKVPGLREIAGSLQIYAKKL